jgi:hypothetical protein
MLARRQLSLRLIDPSKIRFLVRDPLLDGSPRRLDALEAFDVERR